MSNTLCNGVLNTCNILLPSRTVFVGFDKSASFYNSRFEVQLWFFVVSIATPFFNLYYKTQVPVCNAVSAGFVWCQQAANRSFSMTGFWSVVSSGDHGFVGTLRFCRDCG